MSDSSTRVERLFLGRCLGSPLPPRAGGSGLVAMGSSGTAFAGRLRQVATDGVRSR